MSKSFPTTKLTMDKWTNGQMLIPAILDVFSKVDFEYPKELLESHNDYFLALDEIDIKKEIFSKYQVLIADFYNIPIGNV